MQQLSGMDASFLYAEVPNAHMAGAGLSIYDPSTAPGGKVTFKGILEHIEARLHEAKTFRRRLVRVPFDLDHPYWIEDPSFDLEFHVRHIALPHPGDWRQLCIQAARLVARPLDLSRPLWEFYVVEGLDRVEGVPEGSFAVVSKIHHAAIDGMAGMEMTNAIHDHSPDAEPNPPAEAWQPESVPSATTLLARASINNTMRPFKFAQGRGPHGSRGRAHPARAGPPAARSRLRSPSPGRAGAARSARTGSSTGAPSRWTSCGTSRPRSPAPP